MVAAQAFIILFILSGKKSPRWPTYPQDFRVLLFAAACGFIYRGTDFVVLGWLHTPEPKPGEITSPGFILLFILTLLFVRWAHHTACKIYPESMWARIRIAERLAQWGDGALGTLYLRGVNVAPPKGGMHDNSGDETPLKLKDDL